MVDVAQVERKISTVNRTVLAREIGLTRNHVSQVLSGRSVPSLPVAAKMAKSMGITLDQLWEGLCGKAPVSVN